MKMQFQVLFSLLSSVVMVTMDLIASLLSVVQPQFWGPRCKQAHKNQRTGPAVGSASLLMGHRQQMQRAEQWIDPKA